MNNRKVLMLVYSHYPGDTRVRKEALSLKNNGYEVDVICLKNKSESKREIFEEINIYRINIEKKRGGVFTYLFNYITFFIIAFFVVNFLYFKEKHKFIHIHNMPNFLVFATVIPKILGSKIILDMHDPMPELLSSVLNTNNKMLRNILILEEKLSVFFSNRIITTNIAFKELFISRGCPENKITIVMNSPYTEIFNKIRPKARDDNNFVILYNGSIVKRHGLDILVDAVNKLIEKIPNIKLKIYGGGEFLEEVFKKIREYKLDNYIEYHEGVLIDYLIKEISECNVGVIPNRLNEFTNLNFPIRIFEFIHFKKPVIVPKTEGIKDYFDENSIFYFTPNDPEDLARIIDYIYKGNQQINKIIEKGYLVYQKNNWEFQRKNLLNLYNS